MAKLFNAGGVFIECIAERAVWTAKTKTLKFFPGIIGHRGTTEIKRTTEDHRDKEGHRE